MAILKYSIRFNLQHNKKSDSAIRCVVRFNNERVIFGTNLKIKSKFWNAKAQEAKSTTVFDASDINTKLNEIRTFINAEFEKLDTYPVASYLKSRCLDFIGTEQKQEDAVERYFISHLQSVTDGIESGDIRIQSGRNAGKRYSSNTTKTYKTALTIFRGMAEHFGKRDYLFTEIDKSFYESFQEYFYGHRKFSSGYFATMLRVLKSSMTMAQESGLHNNTAHASKHFVKPAYESDTVYLSVNQLDALNNVQVSGHLANARDIFLVGCWTGLRFSDFSELTIDDIKDEFIQVVTGKTGERVSIPCHPVIEQVIKRNNGKFPKKISNQKLNQYIKEVAALAKLTNIVSVRRNVGGEDIIEDIQFNKLITTHTARRSFATNMFKMGIPTFVIMAITGHRTESAFFRYIRVSGQEKAQMMREMWEKLGIFK